MTQTVTKRVSMMGILEAEQIVIAALTALLNVCNGAINWDGQGFNKPDASFARSLMESANRFGGLTPRQLVATRNMLQKYTKQLSGFGIELPSIEDVKAAASAKEEAKSHQVVAPQVASQASTQQEQPKPTGKISLSGNFIKLSWEKGDPDFQKNLDAVRALKNKYKGIAYDGTGAWLLPKALLPVVIETFTKFEGDEDIAERLNAIKDAAGRKAREEEEARQRKLAFIDSLLASVDLDAPLKDGRKLYQHQKDVVRRMLSTEYHGFIDSHDVGLGKTIEGLMVAKAYQNVTGCAVYVVVPPIAITNWYREAESVGVSIEVFSWGKVPPPPEMTPYIYICDEAHRMQGGNKTLRGRASLELAKKAIAFFPLTGTPASNAKAINLYPLLDGVDHPIAKDKKEYERRYCGADIVSYGSKTFYKADGNTNMYEFHQRIKDVIDYKLKRDCLDMPQFNRLMETVVLSRAAQKAYNETLQRLHDEHEARVAEKVIELRQMWSEHVEQVIEGAIKSARKEKTQEFLNDCRNYGMKTFVEFNVDIANQAVRVLNRMLYVDRQPIPQDFDAHHELFAKFYGITPSLLADFEDIARQGDVLVILGQLRHGSEVAKVEATVEKAVEIIEAGHQIVIFGLHIDSTDMVAEQIAKELGLKAPLPVVNGQKMSQKQKQEIMDRFQAKDDNKPLEEKIFIATMGAASESITLTEAHHMILMSRDFVPARLTQAEGRIDRVSQTKDMTCYWMRYGAIDDKWDDALRAKMENINLMLKGKRVTDVKIEDFADEIIQATLGSK